MLIVLLKRCHFDRSESRQIGTNEVEKSFFNRFLDSGDLVAFARNDNFNGFKRANAYMSKFGLKRI